MNLRYVNRDGKKVLQSYDEAFDVWMEVPEFEEEPKQPKQTMKEKLTQKIHDYVNNKSSWYNEEVAQIAIEFFKEIISEPPIISTAHYSDLIRRDALLRKLEE